MCVCSFQVLSKVLFIIMVEILLKLQRPFSQGVPKEEIQQWRQARSRQGEKETLNIISREQKGNRHVKFKWKLTVNSNETLKGNHTAR